MSKLLANATIALSLILGASAFTPAWAGSVHNQKCPAAKHKHAKQRPVAAKPQPARGVMLVEHRKQDVQILSFGP
ncbi:MAG TPA: hypothetical protein VFO12_06115 [Sphingomicrobium sp.]|nr:hypothetical protein [Sphingomicrobium sp.]